MSASLLSAYAAVGEDHLKQAETLRRFEARADPAFAAFDFDEFKDPAQVTAEELVASLEQLPFGPGPRLVVVRDADRLPKEVSEAVVAYLERPNPSSCLLLIADRLPKNTRLYRAVEGLGKRAIVSCEAKKPWDLPDEVRRLAVKRGLTLEPRVAEELVERLGPSVDALDNALATLAATQPANGRVSLAMVRAQVRRVTEAKPWEVADAVCERDGVRALELLSAVKPNGLVGVHLFVCERLRELACAQSCGAGALTAEFGGRSWKYKRHRGWAARFSPRELAQGLADGALVERALKGSGDGEGALRVWLLSLCDRNAPGLGALRGEER